MNAFCGLVPRPSAELGAGSTVFIVSDEVPANTRLLIGDEIFLSASISSSALERCRGEGEWAALDLKMEAPPVLLVLAAESIEGHWSDCTCASSVRYGLGRGVRFTGKKEPALSLLLAGRVNERRLAGRSSNLSVFSAGEVSVTRVPGESLGDSEPDLRERLPHLNTLVESLVGASTTSRSAQ